MPSVPLLPNPHGRPPVLRHYVQSSPHLLDRSSMAKQNLSHRTNVIRDGSPSRIRSVRRISLGMTTRPRSSMRRTIPVAFISRSPLSIGCACSLCRFWENMRRRASARRHPFFTSHAYFFFEQEQFENAAKLRPRHCKCGTEQRNSGKRDQPKNEIV